MPRRHPPDPRQAAEIYQFLARYPHCSAAHPAHSFGLALRTAAASRATFTRRAGLEGVPTRHGGTRRPFRPLPHTPLELAGTAWVRLAPDTDPAVIPEALQAFLLQPRRGRFTARVALAPGPAKRRGRGHPGAQP